MARLSSDIPQFLIVILSSVDYSKINTGHYDAWMKIIKENIGNHLKKKKEPAILLEYNFPIRQDFCDLINGYDFNSLPIYKQLALMPLIKIWANNNLPMLNKL